MSAQLKARQRVPGTFGHGPLSTPNSKLIVSWHVGDRTQQTGVSFMSDLRARLANKVQLTTDGLKAYLAAVNEIDFDADYAMLSKIFASDTQHRLQPL